MATKAADTLLRRVRALADGPDAGGESDQELLERFTQQRDESVFTYWHKNGQISSLHDSKNGVKHGREAAWNEKGELQYDCIYDNGRLLK